MAKNLSVDRRVTTQEAKAPFKKTKNLQPSTSGNNTDTSTKFDLKRSQSAFPQHEEHERRRILLFTCFLINIFVGLLATGF